MLRKIGSGPGAFRGGEEVMGACTPGEHAARALGTPQGAEEAEPAEAQELSSTAGQGVADTRSQNQPRAVGSSAQSNATEKATAVRVPKCLSDLAIRRSSVTLAVAVGAVGAQETGTEGVKTGKAGKALPQ